VPRSGQEKPAPDSLGSDRHRPIEPAPGSYVHEN
jgi:poly(3-hydroxyalkanoate) synthetase